ncbi:MAG: hypothetical protein HY966_04035 [Ignavibacteriales bacterium]|nr:hypothetical protein [Ignavibacteriales bacterium]
MKNQHRLLAWAIPLAIIFLWMGSGTAVAQQTPHVDATLNFSDYDVIYLTDWVDVKNQSIKSSVPNFSLDLSVRGGGSLDVCMYVEVQVQLVGRSNELMLQSYTKNFKIPGVRTVTAGEFAGSNPSSDIDERNNPPRYENKTLRKVIEDQANLYATAAAGTYRLLMEILPATKTNADIPSRAVKYGVVQRTIVIPLQTATVQTDLIEPKNGTFFSNLAPTFNWATQAPKTTLRVYEVLCNHRSPQDALNGTPYLTQNLSGVTSLTYPSTASRKLQQDRAYVWVVDGDVNTSRGVTQSSSVPFVFRVTDDKVGLMLDNFFSQVGGQGAATVTTLRADPNYWVYLSNCARATIDGRTLTEGDLQNILNDLALQQDNQLQVSVENQ